MSSMNPINIYFSVKEDLLIDLDLPPSTKPSTPKRATNQNNVSIIDQPIDVPEIGNSILFFV